MPLHNYSFEALGTRWEITTDTVIPDSIKKEIQDRIELFDATYSRFRSDSLVAEMKKKSGTFHFPADVKKLVAFYKKIYIVTKRKVTPFIGETLEHAGYDAKYSFKESEYTPVPEWGNTLTIKGSILHTSRPVTFDVGAAGKGYLVDILAGILDTHGVNEYVIDASGDLVHKGGSENRVGLEHPQKPGTVIGVVDVRNASLCASASNRRVWGKGMHHILDPDTQQPVQEVIATWVIADETMIADGLATALFFADPNTLATEFDFQYVRMHSNGTLDYSDNFSGELF